MNSSEITRAKKIIQRVVYATVATSTADGQPWNTPVAHVHDTELNIYWFSDKQGQHSKNVRQNNQVFIVIYDSSAPEGQGEGVYIQARAAELTEPGEIMNARQIKYGANYAGSSDDFLGNAVRRVYKAVPEKMWVNKTEVKDGIFVRDFRVEIPINKLQEALNNETA